MSGGGGSEMDGWVGEWGKGEGRGREGRGERRDDGVGWIFGLLIGALLDGVSDGIGALI